MPERINLCTPVRESLIAAGISTVKVVSAVNAALGELAVASRDAKTGDGRVTKDSYKVTQTVSEKYEGKRTISLLFDAWHSKIAQAEKVASFESVRIPSLFTEWLRKMKTEEPEAKPKSKKPKPEPASAEVKS